MPTDDEVVDGASEGEVMDSFVEGGEGLLFDAAGWLFGALRVCCCGRLRAAKLGVYSFTFDASSNDGTFPGRGGRLGAGPLCSGESIPSGEGVLSFLDPGRGHWGIGVGRDITDAFAS